MPETPSLGARIVGVIGFVGHLATLIWYAASGLVAPGWAVAALLVVWVALLVVAIMLWRSGHPAWILLVPVAATAIWFAAISAGETFLHWTA
jgi:hypothetical protein